MAEKDYAPLTTACVRALNDKLYEKRKAAALEIEKMVKDFVAGENTAQIKRLLKVLGDDFTLSHNPNSKKGGLIGLAAMAIGLGKDTSLYINEMVKPIMACFDDPDSRVRYYACESLYNVVKVARGSVLPYFNDIFDALSKLAADPDQNVKNGSELLDRLMKDIVTESSSFDLVKFIPLLRERIYVNNKNPFARQYLVSWVSVLDSVPDIDMLVFLPEILDGLLQILEDPTSEIKKMCEAVLGEFLKSIIQNPQKVDFAAMVNILIVHSQSTDNLVQLTAITWLREFVNLAGRALLPFASGILTAVLPTLAYDKDEKKGIRDVAMAVNHSLTQLITPEDDRDLPEGSEDQDAEEGKDQNSEEAKRKCCAYVQLDLAPVVDVLTKQLKHGSVHTRIAALKWIYHLHIKIPTKIFRHVEDIFPVLLLTLSDNSDEVVLLALEVLAEISSSPTGDKQTGQLECVTLPSPMKEMVQRSQTMNSYFTKFMVALLNLFSSDKHLLEARCSFIIRQLCVLMNAYDIYRTISEILLYHSDVEFARHMIQTLNTILMTSSELFELRNQLKDLKTKESCSLFCCLYQSWCHNPVATVSLCLLTQNYKHAYDLLQLFGDLEVTVDFLTEIDKLVQLLESPIFTYLRLQLLDTQRNPYLVKSLYGLLMLLPQSEAFHTLRQRLACVPNLQVFAQQNSPKAPPGDGNVQKTQEKHINFNELIEHFKVTQEKHRQAQRMSKLKQISNCEKR